MCLCVAPTGSSAEAGAASVRMQCAAMVPVHAVGLHSSSTQKRYKVTKVFVQYVQMHVSSTDLISDDLSSLFHTSDAKVLRSNEILGI